jgi:aryl-alcohol dehydrogenase-like predicted oxidoreductase
MVPRRSLGALEVTSIGLGCMAMSHGYGRTREEDAKETLFQAADLGIDLLDTADLYGMGDNERLLGRLLAGLRDRFLISTKFGYVIDPRHPKRRDLCGAPEQVAAACNASLKRLKTDHIDLYVYHRVDPNVPIEDTVGAMAALVAAGKVRHLGLSEVSATTLTRAHAVHPICAVQSEYSIATRDPEGGVLAACKALGVGFVAYSPLGRGLLTGSFRHIEDLEDDDSRRGNPRFQQLDANLALIDGVAAIAEEYEATPSQIALAWLLHKAPFVVPIPGTRSPLRLQENMDAARIALPKRVIRRLDALGAAVGDRFPPGGMAQLDR